MGTAGSGSTHVGGLPGSALEGRHGLAEAVGAPIAVRPPLCNVYGMTGHEFERWVRALGLRSGTMVAFDPGPGMGSHGRLYYGNRFTTRKDRRKEIGPGLLKAMLDQLGLRRDDLEG
jgi:mRNA interferase HicA